jgi:hypothetical protein
LFCFFDVKISSQVRLSQIKSVFISTEVNTALGRLGESGTS